MSSTSSYQNQNQTQTKTILIVLIVAGVVSLVTVSLRFRSRWKVKTWLDYLILCSWLLASAPLVLIIVSTERGGIGHHIDSNGFNAQVKFLKELYASKIMSALAIIATHISVTWSCYKAFATLQKPLSWIGGVIVTGDLAFLIAAIVPCRHIHDFWNIAEKGAHSTYHFSLANAAYNAIAYCLITGLPVFFFSTMKLSSSNKVIVIGLWLFSGLSVVIVCIWRFYSFLHLDLNSSDTTWEMVIPVLSLIVELHVGIFSVCLPPLRGYLRELLQFKRPGNAEDESKKMRPQHTETQTLATWVGRRSSELKLGSKRCDFEESDSEDKISSPRSASTVCISLV